MIICLNSDPTSDPSDCQDDDNAVSNAGNFAPPSCSLLTPGIQECAKDQLGQYCKKSCGICPGWYHIS